MFMKLGVALNVVGASLVAVPVLGYVVAPFFKKQKNQWISLGDIAQFPIDETRLVVYQNPVKNKWDGYVADVPCWVRRVKEKSFQVFAINCTHLGCPVEWFPESALFMCPCHGSVFYQDGQHAAGPAPRRLYEYQVRLVDKDGGKELEVLGGRLPILTEPV
jgi:Rieske Fe-S protein